MFLAGVFIDIDTFNCWVNDNGASLFRGLAKYIELLLLGPPSTTTTATTLPPPRGPDGAAPTPVPSW